jgi:outer membrane immunogenic protein
LDSSGALFGGQVGCNYQFWTNWVVGVQGDFAGTDFNGKAHDVFANDPFLSYGLISEKSDWLGSVTGRLGYTFLNNQALVYVKGGGAWIHNKWDTSLATLPFSNTGQNLFDETRSGWTIGGGVEWTLWSPAWTAFVEYNYYDFNNGGLNQTAVFFGGAETTFQTKRQEINTVKVGVNYRFWGSGGVWGGP